MTKKRDTLSVLDLFAGAGGLTEGLHRSSSAFETVRAVESDVLAAATFDANHGAGVTYAGRIEDWLKEDTVPSVDLLVGGPPCQGFSQLNRSKVGIERNDLWKSYAETVVRAQPKWFVLENVPAFLKSAEFAELQKASEPGGWLADWRFKAWVLMAADFGAAQLRRRAVVIGHHRDLPEPAWPVPTHVGSHKPLKKVLLGVAETVTRQDFPDRQTEVDGRLVPGTFETHELHVTRHYEPRSLDRFAHIPEGGNRHNLPWALQTPGWRNHTTGSGDVMGRLLWDKPSVTIRTEFFKPEKGRYLHPTEPRAITHFEAARIQGFPDDYKWVGGKTHIARQIGNAVPIPLGVAIGKAIARAASESA
ncbi:DNA (cytosine-5)-methyltransferase 1 [Yimella lutea]|uniref:Cytosine-specific methyltransferase n=2 Tax=Yimella lutea TaxID=587872 RepID=A0A542ECL1_9MICO|nr:DNA (cytosine-5)-methyltransferase 1 [Yimella lutea]